MNPQRIRKLFSLQSSYKVRMLKTRKESLL
jgi:hypothetical protein